MLLKQRAFVVKRSSDKKKKGGQVSWRKNGTVEGAWIVAKAHAGWEL